MTDTTEDRKQFNTNEPFKAIVDLFLRGNPMIQEIPIDLDLQDGDFRGVMQAKDREKVSLQTFVMVLRHKTDPDTRYMIIHFNDKDLPTVPFICPVTLTDDPDSGTKFIFNALYQITELPDAIEQMKNPTVEAFFSLALEYNEEKDEVSLTNYGKALAALLTKGLALTRGVDGEAIH